MKKSTVPEPIPLADELRAEYDFDYGKARPNRFAAGGDEQVVVTLDPDVARVFTTSESVNTILRALITAMPKSFPKKAMARR